MSEAQITYEHSIKVDGDKLQGYKNFIDSLDEQGAKDYLELALRGESMDDTTDYFEFDEGMTLALMENDPEKQDEMEAALHEHRPPELQAFEDLDAYSQVDPSILIQLVKKAKMEPKTRAVLYQPIAKLATAHFATTSLLERVQGARHIARSKELEALVLEMHYLLQLKAKLDDVRVNADLDKEGIRSKAARNEILRKRKEETVDEVALFIKNRIEKTS